MSRRLIIAGILIMTLLTAAGSKAAAPPKVVFIRYPIPTADFATVVDGFKKTMASRGFLTGDNIEYIDILTRSTDTASVPDVLAAVKEWQGKAAMIITCGWVSMYARAQLKESNTPQLFVPVLESVARRMLPSLSQPPETNLSGLYLMYPPEKILRLTRLLLPRITNYAYVYDSAIPADLVFKAAYEQVPPHNSHGLTLHCLDLAEGVDRVLDDLKRLKIEAYGGIVGIFNHRQALTASGLPVITSFTLDIEEEELARHLQHGNIVAGLYNPFRYCGEQAAEMTADIFTGKNTIEKTIPRPSMQIAFINLEAANRLKIQVPFIALESVDRVIQ